MTTFKTLLMTAAMVAAPTIAFAQSSATDAKDYAADKAKDAAVDVAKDNMTSEDALVAGKTMFKGGSTTDAGVAVIKNRVDGKVDSMTGGAVSMDDVSKDGMMDAGKDMAMDKAASSATTYTGTTGATDVMSKDGMMDAGKDMAMDKAASSATTFSSGTTAVIPKSTTYTTTTSAPATVYTGTTVSSSNTNYVNGTYNGQAYQGTMTLPGQSFSQPSYSTTTSTVTSGSSGIACPAGTKDAGDGTCMVTGNWGG